MIHIFQYAIMIMVNLHLYKFYLIIYIDIAFKTAIKVDTAKSEAIKALDKIGEENLKYYDVQFVLTYTGEDENSNFPIFGAKSANSLKVVW